MPRRTISDSEAWKKMVLRSMPPPAWLGRDAPEGDVVISSRVRFARNLDGVPVPHLCTPEQLREVQRLILKSAEGLELEVHKRFTEAERDYLIGCRLVSPEFATLEPGRALLMDPERSVSIMINEEDHLRLQAVTAGWSIANAERLADHLLARLQGMPDTPDALFGEPAKRSVHGLRFAREGGGYATASPYNAGEGRRLSAMFHLIGLAHAKRLPVVLTALAEMGMTARGVYGESSRGVGAFFQVSVTSGPMSHFAGACEYLMREEREARWDVPRERLIEHAQAAVEFATASSQITLADALRVLAWARWASSTGLDGFPTSHREVDHWVSTLEVRSTHDEEAASRHRASFLRERLS
jgi:protein arginine kinase